MTTADLPTLRAPNGFTEALDAETLSQLGSDQLAAFLLERRWFGGKGRAPARVRISEVIRLRGGSLRVGIMVAAVARLDVDDAEGGTTSYQLPLAIVAEDAPCMPSAILARVDGGSKKGYLFDALEDERFRAALGNAFAPGTMFASSTDGDAARWVVELVNGGGPAQQDLSLLPSRVMRAEQSNTSVVYGDAAIFKLFRRLEPGTNPDVEIGHFLTTRTRFTHTPPLLGVVRYEGSDGLHSIAGMLQGFLPGSTDAWHHALDQSRSYFADRGGEETAHPFADDAERLGRITRELHDALASPHDDASFTPRPATRADVERWADSARRRIEDALSLLGERVDAGRVTDVRTARGVIEHREAYLSRLDELVAVIGGDAGQLIRHHGDYHLGQVLRTRDGDFQIIDFEGEPARPLAERRERSSALRDVAGMLRSFAYAAATLAAERGSDGADDATLRRAARWERGAREAFLGGYLGGASASFLPPTGQRVDALRELFETEKVFYEMSYELNNRPAWVWIPIAGAAALRAAPAGRS
ncbi:MAG TPA: putative maltokinase [Gemmatimonadaceae bacterium]|nr:putative maltokinase [Gemmatimonadaceae bacterium]